jgi:hypothetical protein
MDLLKLLIFILLVFFTEYNFKFTNLFVTKEGFEDKFSFNTKENFSTEKKEYSPGCYIFTRNCNDNEYWKEKSTGEWYNDELDGVAPVNSKEECKNKQTNVKEMCGTRAYVRNMYVPSPNTTLDPNATNPEPKPTTTKKEYSPGCYIFTRNCNDNEYWKENSTGEWYNDEVDGVAPVNSKEECKNKQTNVKEMCGTRAYVRNMYVPRPNTTLAPTTVSPVTKQPYTYKAGTDVYELKWNTGSKMTERYPEAKLLTKDYTKYFHMNILSVILDDLYLSPPEVEIDNIDVTDGWFGGNFRIVAKLYGKLNEEILNEFHDTIIENTLTKVIEEYNQNSNNEGSTNTEASNNVGSTNTEVSNNEGSTNTEPKTTAKVYNPEELSIINDGSSNGERQFLLKVSKNGVENKINYADQVLTPETVTTYVNEENINLNIDPELKKWIMKKLKENPNILPITKNNTEEESKTVKFKCSS